MAEQLDFKDAGRILTVTHVAATEKTSSVIRASRWLGSKAVLFVFSTVAGTVIVDYVDLRGTARALTAALAVAANTLTVVQIDHFVPSLRARFTPNAGSGTTDIDAFLI